MIGWIRYALAWMRWFFWAFNFLRDDRRQVDKVGRLARDLYMDQVLSEKPKREDYR